VLLFGALAFGFALESSFVIHSGGSIYYQPEAKVLFQDDFESGDFRVWNGTYSSSGSTVVEAGNAYEGSYHGSFNTDAVVSGVNCAYSYVDLASVSEVYARAYYYIVDGLPLDDNGDRFGLIAFEVGGQLQTTFRIYRSDGVDKFNIIGYNGTGTVQKSADGVLPTEGRWYCLEFYIKVHSSRGEYRCWINGVERITITDLDTSRFGSGVTRVLFGLTSSVNVQHPVNVYGDCVVVSTRYVGQLKYTFGVIGSDVENPAIRNFYWLFGNQSIRYRAVLPSEVERFEDVDRFDGLVVWTKQGSVYNVTAVKLFAQSRIVISDMLEFCRVLYPSLSSSVQVVSTNTISYVMDWGSFHNGDLVVMRNETGNVGQLTTVLASGLAVFSNITVIARYDVNRIAFFHMNGTSSNSGFYVMDLDATTPETEWVGIWHLFPAIKMVNDFPTGRYARWMANGVSWWNLDWIYNRIDALANANNDVLQKQVIGQSVLGRNITAIVIGNGSRNVIIDGCIHGNEKAAAFSALRIVELLVEFYRSDAWWRSKLANDWRVFVIPVLNPDGFAANTRENANGKDLNRQFPPGATTTEPEAWALRWLMGNYTPTVYINLHEGYYWYPNWMIYGNYETGTNKTITINALKAANETFVSLRHWGWFDEQGKHVWIGEVDTIAQGGVTSLAIAYASYQYGASCMLVESIVWSSSYGSKQSLWAIDYYCTLVLAFLQNNSRLV
jgi:hypothetical protein